MTNKEPINELLMPTMSDLDNLTCRRSKRDRKTPDRFDPSASTTFSKKSPPNLHQMYVMFTMICLVTDGSMSVPSQYISIYRKVVYYTQLIKRHFDGTLNYINPYGICSRIIRQ